MTDYIAGLDGEIIELPPCKGERTIDRLRRVLPARWTWNASANQWESDLGSARWAFQLCDDEDSVSQLWFYPTDTSQAPMLVPE